MSTDNRELIKRLRKLGNYEIEPIFYGYGLCSELSTSSTAARLGDMDNLVSGVAVNWKNYSGDYNYPLLGGRKAYKSNFKKWSKHSIHGRDRREFCLFMADELEKPDNQEQIDKREY